MKVAPKREKIKNEILFVAFERRALLVHYFI